MVGNDDHLTTMTKDIQLFDFQGNDVRIIDQDGNPWFVAQDVCECLGIRNHHDAVSRLDHDEKMGSVLPTPTIGFKKPRQLTNPAFIP